MQSSVSSAHENGERRGERTHLVLDSRVLSLSVLTDDDRVNTVVGGLVALDGAARPDVGVEVEGTAEGQVEGDVALSDC
jgi:hypothetical protein